MSLKRLHEIEMSWEDSVEYFNLGGIQDIHKALGHVQFSSVGKIIFSSLGMHSALPLYRVITSLSKSCGS